jgi:hypothetical protein
MPETRFERIDQRSGIDRVGSPHDMGSHVNLPVSVRHDATLNLPLEWHRGGPNVPIPSPPVPPPPAPTEQELRARLGEALALKRERENEFARIEAAHDRALQRQAKCPTKFADYATLDQSIAEAAITALRCSTGVMSADLSEEHETAIADRELVRAELTAADTAVSTFFAERAVAAKALGDATQAVDVLIARVLTHTAEDVARQVEAAQAHLDALRDLLVGLDRFTTPLRNASVVIQPCTARVYASTDRRHFAKLIDIGPWRAAADALRADADAVVTITLPEVQTEEAA